MHLTNVAIQKTASDYNKAQGCKWGLRNLKMFMVQQHLHPLSLFLFLSCC